VCTKHIRTLAEKCPSILHFVLTKGSGLYKIFSS
jgi:hypothetical protein